MSKKSYKHIQNRLYREIKRRIIAEQTLEFPVPVTVPAIKTNRDIEILAVRNIVPNYLANKIEFVKADIANKIARKLVDEGFVEFLNNENEYTSEIEARIYVVRPTQEGW